MTLQQLATETGLALRIVGDLERGAGNPRLDTIHRIAKVLGVDPAELFAPALAAQPLPSPPKRGPKPATRRAKR